MYLIFRFRRFPKEGIHNSFNAVETHRNSGEGENTANNENREVPGVVLVFKRLEQYHRGSKHQGHCVGQIFQAFDQQFLIGPHTRMILVSQKYKERIRNRFGFKFWPFRPSISFPFVTYTP